MLSIYRNSTCPERQCCSNDDDDDDDNDHGDDDDHDDDDNDDNDDDEALAVNILGGDSKLFATGSTSAK